MSSNPIPQMVNISHALQSTTVEKIRRDIKDFQQVPELSLDQKQTINKYIESLKLAFAQFTKDNEHVEHGDDESITEADTQLYMGLKGMYTDYLSQLERIRGEKASDESSQVDNESILKYIREEFPKKHAKERKLYIEQLIKDYQKHKLPRKSSELVQMIIKLCSLDSDFTPTLKSYICLLKEMGYKYESIKKYIPQDLTNLMLQFFELPAAKNEAVTPLGAGSEDSNKSGSDEEPKKKISFSKYLKKGDGVLDDSNKRDEAPLQDGSSRPTKKMKKNGNSTVFLSSILKTNGSIRKTSNSIKFRDDPQLVRVYGEGLPNEGLGVSPEELKKILKPFKEGEPRETSLIENYEGKAKELNIKFDASPGEADITETKGGSIPCDTVVPLKYRLNFSNFTSGLSSKQPREPFISDEQIESSKNSKGPLIMKAFGKNSLLLRKDRGGIPYRRIPDVVPVNYPPRPAS